VSETPHMASDHTISTDHTIPSLSVPALQELRRIYCKHLLEVFASAETQELFERGCITGRFAQPPGDERPTSFIVEAVTPLGVAALEQTER
jgi:hypothetical protein